jgi:hypothetical protein
VGGGRGFLVRPLDFEGFVDGPGNACERSGDIGLDCVERLRGARCSDV